MICIFDCETIPDVELAKSEFEIELDSPMDICNRAFELQKEKSGSTFLPIPFHKVVAISAVICDDNFEFIKVGTFQKDSLVCDEENLIREFLDFIDKQKPKLVSFNGNGFDIPMLFVRAMKYNISCKAYFNSDKWEGYKSRYSEKANLDLLDSIANFGAVRGLKLDTISKMVGIPGKFDVHGDEVVRLYFENEHNKIKEYCESDVLNTYWLMLKYEILKGSLNRKSYVKILENFFDKLPQNRSYSEVFLNFIKRELGKLNDS